MQRLGAHQHAAATAAEHAAPRLRLPVATTRYRVSMQLGVVPNSGLECPEFNSWLLLIIRLAVS